MEVCAPCAESVTGDANAFPSLDLSENHSQSSNSEDVGCLISNVEKAIAESLHIDDAQESGCAREGDVVENGEGKNIYKGCKVSPMKSSEKILGKCATFSCAGMMLRRSSADNEQQVEPGIAAHGHLDEDGMGSLCGGSKSLHTSATLVSAMKGSREKQGLSPKKLSVSWAPDVYDPIPTSLSHTVPKGKTKQRLQHKRNDNKKKNSKNKHKGNSSRGSGGSKDKKQYRRSSGGASCDRLLVVSDRHDDFEMSSPDYCGKTFLIQSLTKVHYSTAEAL